MIQGDFISIKMVKTLERQKHVLTSYILMLSRQLGGSMWGQNY